MRRSERHVVDTLRTEPARGPAGPPPITTPHSTDNLQSEKRDDQGKKSPTESTSTNTASMAKNKRLKTPGGGVKPRGKPSGKPNPKGISKPTSNKKPGSKPNSNSNAKPTAAKPPPEPTIPLEAHERILVLGDGDLSFSRSLVDTHGCYSLLATTFDTETELLAKYPQAAENAAAIVGEEQRVLYGVDATKLTQREVKKTFGGWERVVFNFPHVGGKSTDVNRQVRYNQEMLVQFFKATKPLLAGHGTIIVTLFEGEPYTLWNIRDLARHSGLEVQTSFRFQAEAYPGYEHRRTLGNIEGGGGWKGEERLSRTYVFQNKEANLQQPSKKRKKGNETESEDDD